MIIIAINTIIILFNEISPFGIKYVTTILLSLFAKINLFLVHHPSLAETLLKSIIAFSLVILYNIFILRASVAELADAPDLGSGGFTVGVQVPSLAPFLYPNPSKPSVMDGLFFLASACLKENLNE